MGFWSLQLFKNKALGVEVTCRRASFQEALFIHQFFSDTTEGGIGNTQKSSDVF